MAKYRDMSFAAWAARSFDWDIQPTMVELAVDDARIDLAFSAQRELDDERASQMAQHYMAAAAAGVTVAELPDGRLVFVDGQHRWRAASDSRAPTILALVFKMSQEQASALFRLKNGPGVRLVQHIDSTNAAVEATDPRYVHMTAILQEFDCFLDREHSWKPGAINASASLEKIYNVDDGDLLAATLMAITETWGHDHNVLISPILEGMALFIAHHQDDLHTSQMRDLKEKLAKQGYEDLWSHARGNFRRIRGATQSTYVEQEIVTTYNLRRTSTRLPERTARQLAQLPDLAHLALANIVPPTLPLTPASEGEVG